MSKMAILPCFLFLWASLFPGLCSVSRRRWTPRDCVERRVRMTEDNIMRVVDYFKYCRDVAGSMEDDDRRRVFGRAVARQLKDSARRYASEVGPGPGPPKLRTARRRLTLIYHQLLRGSTPLNVTCTTLPPPTDIYDECGCPDDEPEDTSTSFWQFCPSILICALYVLLLIMTILMAIFMCRKIRKKDCEPPDPCELDLEECINEILKHDPKARTDADIKNALASIYGKKEGKDKGGSGGSRESGRWTGGPKDGIPAPGNKKLKTKSAVRISANPPVSPEDPEETNPHTTTLSELTSSDIGTESEREILTRTKSVL